MTITIITGTDTDVGKTIAAATIAAAMLDQELDFVVVKPVQTGVVGEEEGDADVVATLAALPAHRIQEWSRLPEPLAPTTAARRAGVRLPSMAQVADKIVELAAHQHVVVEGAGGLLVGLDDDAAGLLALADHLVRRGYRPQFVVVTRAGLGTLNHTQLTVNAIVQAGHSVAGLIVGAWPDNPGLAEQCNATELPAIAPVLATLPDGLGSSPDRLRSIAHDLADSLTGALL